MAEKELAGIGSRETPPLYQLFMTCAGRVLATDYTLNSGGAIGADTAFEEGFVSVGGKVQIFRPGEPKPTDPKHWLYPAVDDLISWREARRIAQGVHPKWGAMDAFKQDLHTRNVFQILGRNLEKPVEFVFYYAQEIDGVPKGGTATAVKLARRNRIQTSNLYFLSEQDLYENQAAPGVWRPKYVREVIEATSR